MKLCVAGGAALILMQLSAAHADEPIDRNTSCAAVRKVMDASEPDRAQMRKIFAAVQHVFAILDAKNEVQGRPKIYDRMSKDGKLNTVAIVSARCDDHPSDTLEQSAVTVYGTLEAMGDAMGVNAPGE